MRVLFVVNAHSGTGANKEILNAITREADRAGYTYSVFEMKCKVGEDEENIRREIDNYQPEVVAAAGGDGTVNLLATILAGSEISLAIIPCGSANGMAKELGIDVQIPSAVDLIAAGVSWQIDLLHINEKISIHLADVGLNARIVKRFESDLRRGLLTYGRHLFSEVFLLKKYRFYIQADGKSITRKAVSLTFANASKYGTGAIINASGKLDDGYFELIIVKPFPKIKLFSIAWKMFSGTLQTSEYVEVVRCHEATVRCKKPTTLQVDGEVIGKVKEIRINILPKALKVIVPKSYLKTV
ncbi:MAG: diacylglycerol/lipid kinase family protein [Sphingobacteriaceae bacterium]